MNNISASFHDNFKIIPTRFDIEQQSWTSHLSMFSSMNEGSTYIFFTCIVARTSNRVYSRKKESYRLLSRKVWGLLSVSISFTVGARPRSSESLLSTARAFLSPPRFTLGSHSIWPSRSVVTARRLYKFYIIFMRHKVVEKPTEKRREKKRVGVRERRRGSSRFKSSLSATSPPPPVGVIVTWLGGAFCIPSCLLVGVGYKREGKADDCKRGCCAALGVVVVVNCSSPDELYIERRFVSCLVKKFAIANTFFYP